MGNFSIALSGLQANSVALNTIGNNLANLNTTAFKGQTTAFEDLFYQQVGQSGSGDNIQVGAGVKVSATTSDFTEGTLLPDSNANPADVAIAGNGFFVVQQNNQQSLTRAGNFQLASNGNLITQDGQQVLGYNAVNGVINVNATVGPINLPVGVNVGAQATANFGVTTNLNSGATVGTSFLTPVTMYDSLGQSHTVSVNYTKSATNSWNYAVTLPAADATGVPVANTGTLTFNASGVLTAPTGSVTGISFPGMTDGAAPLTFNWQLDDASGNPTITQLATASTNTTSTQDGFTSGVYQSFQVDKAGVVTATFSNNRTTTIGQLAVATVGNVEGLSIAGQNNFSTTAASGLATIGVAGLGGRGTIIDGALEQSNINISTEFSHLIVAQRAFEANSKTITAFDTVSQTAIAMIR